MGAAVFDIAIEQQFGADRVEPEVQLVFEADPASEHVAARQAVEPPPRGGVERAGALIDQRGCDRHVAEVGAADVAMQKLVQHRFVAAVVEFVLDRLEVVVIVGAGFRSRRAPATVGCAVTRERPNPRWSPSSRANSLATSQPRVAALGFDDQKRFRDDALHDADVGSVASEQCFVRAKEDAVALMRAEIAGQVFPCWK